MHESRLELDDEGRVLGAPAEPLDLVADPEPRQRVRLPRGTGVAALAALALLALWFTVRPAPGPPLAATVSGVGLAPPVSVGDPLVGLYEVTAAAPSTEVEVRGLVGPGVRASSAYVDQAGRGVRVAVVPDCVQPAALDGTYALALTVTGPGGSTTDGLLPLADTTVDWAAAIEDQCWTQTTRAGISLVDLRARADVPRGLVLVSAALRNSTGLDLAVRAVDVADIATLEDAPVADLRADRESVADARVTGRCGTAGSPPSLSWAVGPQGEPPRLIVTTPLEPAARLEIAQAMGLLCSSAPPTTVTVVSARAVPGNPLETWVGGAAVEVRLRLSTGAVSVALGSDPAGATSDARRSFSYETVAGPVQNAEVVVRWNVPCVVAPNRTLPVLTRTQRLAFASAVQLTSARIDEAVSRACGVRP